MDHVATTQTARVPSRAKRVLVPREHGAWAMWLVPGIVGMALAGREWGLSAALLVAALCLFWARYPLWLWAKSKWRAFPASALPSTVAIAAAGAAIGLVVAFVYRREALLAFGAAGVVAVGAHMLLTARGWDRGLAAESMGIAGLGLAGPAAYYAGAGHMSSQALLAWFLPALFFGISVFYVKLRVDGYVRLKAGKSPAELRARLLAYLTLAAGALAVLVGLDVAPATVFLAYLPATIYACWPSLREASPPRLRRLGVTWAVQSTVFAALLIVLL